MERYFRDKKCAIIISLFCMILWGSAIPLIKCTYSVMHIAPENIGAKILVAGIRFCIAGILGLGYFALLDHEKSNVKLSWKYVLILSLIQTSIQYLFYYLGLANTMGVKASIIQASNAFFIVIISAMVLKDDKITPRRMMSLVIGTAGIIIANLKPGSEMSFHMNGEGFILAATIFNATATVYVRKYGKNQNAALVSGLQFFMGSIPLIIIGMVCCKELPVFTVQAVLMLVYGGFISATAFTLWSILLKYQNSGEFGVYKLFIPVFGSVFSLLVLKESFTPNLLVGMVLVLLGSLILNKKTNCKMKLN